MSATDGEAVAHLEAVESGPADGLLIALVHGALDRRAGMARIGRRLDRRFRVLRFDRRGYGGSNPHPGPFTLEANADDLERLLGGRRALLVGHSLGSHVVLKLAARHPEQIVGVVAYEPPLSWEPWWPGTTGGAFALQELDPGDAAESFMRRMAGDHIWEGLPEGTRAARRSEGRAFVDELRDLRAGPPWDPATITMPVMVGYGGESRDHHVTGARLVASRLVHGHAVELTGSGHGAHTSAAALFVERLIEPLLSGLTPEA